MLHMLSVTLDQDDPRPRDITTIMTGFQNPMDGASALLISISVVVATLAGSPASIATAHPTDTRKGGVWARVCAPRPRTNGASSTSPSSRRTSTGSIRTWRQWDPTRWMRSVTVSRSRCPAKTPPSPSCGLTSRASPTTSWHRSRRTGSTRRQRSSRRRGLSRFPGETASTWPRQAAARRSPSCCPPSSTSTRSRRCGRGTGLSCWCWPQRGSWRCRYRRWRGGTGPRAGCGTRASTAACPAASRRGTCGGGWTYASRRQGVSSTSSRRAPPTCAESRTWCWTRRTACSTWGSSRRSAPSWRRSGRTDRHSCSRRRGPRRSSAWPTTSFETT
mmetsp:Transcript_70452/g.187993  ORF Transcript_70452/g.187993 Transcript_70452/m.187993 type:complete len:332 (-) Transcript_70452:689-1684(-)